MNQRIRPPIGPHGAVELPRVVVDSYNLELRDREGFIGDRASKGAFAELLENWRKAFRKRDEDPLGDKDSDRISKKKLDELLLEGDSEAAGVVHGAVEDFAQELASVIRRFLKVKSWQKTERVVVGGGFRDSRIGELAIGRTNAILKSEKIKTTLVPIRYDPDEAALIGAQHLIPAWMLSGYDGILAIDIGGSNVRAGIVLHHMKKARDLSKSEVWEAELWRHADDAPKRDEAVERIVGMLRGLMKAVAKEKIALAPFIGIACPGVIKPDGTIDRGGQNLPGGNWESGRFNLAERLREAIPEIDDHETMIVIHNDAVVQGLCEIPFMTDVEHWGVLTIGTGLGNARFSNRDEDPAKNGKG